MRQAQAVIFPGGNSTCYQAISAHCPQIGVPVNIDQEDNLNQLVRLGTAIVLDPFKIDRKRLLGAVEKIIDEEKYRQKTRKLAKVLARYNGKKKAADLIEKFLKRK